MYVSSIKYCCVIVLSHMDGQMQWLESGQFIAELLNALSVDHFPPEVTSLINVDQQSLNHGY